jgi:hypothetical protein
MAQGTLTAIPPMKSSGSAAAVRSQRARRPRLARTARSARAYVLKSGEVRAGLGSTIRQPCWYETGKAARARPHQAHRPIPASRIKAAIPALAERPGVTFADSTLPPYSAKKGFGKDSRLLSAESAGRVVSNSVKHDISCGGTEIPTSSCVRARRLIVREPCRIRIMKAKWAEETTCPGPKNA